MLRKLKCLFICGLHIIYMFGQNQLNFLTQ